jgi:hypothetical protein
VKFNFREIFENLLQYYQIEDPREQLKNYFSTNEDKLREFFYPHSEENFIYIGEEKGHLGDNINYTSLPRYLKIKFPNKRIIVHPNRYSESIYHQNPYVDSIEVLSEFKPWGEFTELGWGNCVQRRAGSHRIVPAEVRGELFPSKVLQSVLSDKIRKGKSGKLFKFGSGKKQPAERKKILTLHTTGKSAGASMSTSLWKNLVSLLTNEFIVIQVGGKEDKKIRNCDFHFLKVDIKTIIVLISISDYFIGPNSGFMHIAAALEVPSCILVHEIPAKEVRLPNFSDGKLLPRKVNNHLFHLYPHNMHLHLHEDDNPLVPKLSGKTLRLALDRKIFRWPSSRILEYMQFVD